MGRLDQRFPEVAATLVASRRGFPRYYKGFNGKGRRKSGRFRVTEANRIVGNQFSDRTPAGTKYRAD